MASLLFDIPASTFSKKDFTETSSAMLLFLRQDRCICSKTNKSFFQETCWDYANLAVTDDLFHRAILQVFPFIFSERFYALATSFRLPHFLCLANVSSPANVFPSIVLSSAQIDKHLPHLTLVCQCLLLWMLFLLKKNYKVYMLIHWKLSNTDNFY